MIDVIAQTPIEYSKQSRDYQVIARLYTALFNFNKMYIDDMSIWNANIDNKLSHLRAKTLNFHPKHSWEYDALDAATSCLKDLIKRKGTKPAIEDVIRILMRINKLAGGAGIPDVSVDYITYTIIIKIPKQLASMGVVEDLLELIIPIGMGYRIIEYEVVSGQANDNFWFSDKIDVRQNVRILPTYKMGIGGPKIEYIDGKPHYVDDSSMPSLHIAPGVVGEIETDVSIWPDGENQTQGGNKSQGAEVEYNLVTTMGEIRDSHGSKWQIGDDVIQDQTVDDHTQDGVTWKEIEKTKPKKKKK